MNNPDGRVVLRVRQHVNASRERAFAAWTNPDAIVRWWGPPGVTCTHAEIDLRVGGTFKLANEMPDGSTVWITGVYAVVDRPKRLVHSWSVGADSTNGSERVEIDFVESDGGTDIEITHTGIATAELRAGHRGGWIGCLNGLVQLLDDPLHTTQ